MQLFCFVPREVFSRLAVVDVVEKTLVQLQNAAAQRACVCVCVCVCLCVC